VVPILELLQVRWGQVEATLCSQPLPRRVVVVVVGSLQRLVRRVATAGPAVVDLVRRPSRLLVVRPAHQAKGIMAGLELWPAGRTPAAVAEAQEGLEATAARAVEAPAERAHRITSRARLSPMRRGEVVELTALLVVARAGVPTSEGRAATSMWPAQSAPRIPDQAGEALAVGQGRRAGAAPLVWSS